MQDAFDPHLGVGVPPPGYRSIRQREAARAGTRRLVVVAGVLGVGLVSAGAALEYASHRSHAIPVIEADSRPLRVKPENPGGMQIAGAGESILSGAATSKTPETLAPPPETPDPGGLRQQEQAARAREATSPPKVSDTSQVSTKTGAVALNAPKPDDAGPAVSAPIQTQTKAPDAPSASAVTIRPLTTPAPPLAIPAPASPAPLTAPRVAHPAAPASVPPTKLAAAAPPVPAPHSTAVAKANASVPASPTSGRQAQLAAVSSQAAAEAEWLRLSHILPDLLGARHPEFSQVTHEGRVYWRLRTGGFADAAAVSAFCEEIHAKGFNCTPASF